MTIWEAMTTPLREILLTGQMILILLLGYLAMAILPLRRSGKIFTLTAAVEVCNLVLFYLLLDCVFHYGDPKKPRIWPAAVDTFGKFPVAVLIAAEVLSAGYLAWAIQRMIQFRRENLTPLAVKETIDLLPAGVAMAEEDGRVVFSNIWVGSPQAQASGPMV